MVKFSIHDFKKICSEPRGAGLDSLILQSVIGNAENLRSLVADGQYQWVEERFDIKALMLALDDLHNYYGGLDVSDERWALAGYYAYMHFQMLDKELASD